MKLSNYIQLPTINYKLSTFFLLFIAHFSLFTQSFSVLTCSRGEEIYSTFGHSAIRYQDSAHCIDWVYNYGLFDFSDPNFIPKFCQGKLDYMIGKESMNDFMAQYIYQGREVSEQTLKLSPSQRDSLLKFLEWNILEENKYYRYDFLFNNCATKIIEVLEKNCQIRFNFYQDSQQKSFRKLIHINAENSVPWIDWGMDIALGTPTDRIASSREYCFLPEYVAKSIDLSQIVEKEKILINSELPRPFSFQFLPIHFAILLLLLTILYQFYTKKWLKIIMGMHFVLLGIGGLVIGFEWFFTEHTVTKLNWNLGWLNPFLLIYGIFIILNKKNKWLDLIISIGFTASLIAVIIHIQDFHIASILMINSGFIFHNVKIYSRLKK